MKYQHGNMSDQQLVRPLTLSKHSGTHGAICESVAEKGKPQIRRLETIK
jgi:hypothetical protein